MLLFIYDKSNHAYAYDSIHVALYQMINLQIENIIYSFVTYVNIKLHDKCSLRDHMKGNHV